MNQLPPVPDNCIRLRLVRLWSATGHSHRFFRKSRTILPASSSFGSALTSGLQQTRKTLTLNPCGRVQTIQGKNCRHQINAFHKLVHDFMFWKQVWVPHDERHSVELPINSLSV